MYPKSGSKLEGTPIHQPVARTDDKGHFMSELRFNLHPGKYFVTANTNELNATQNFEVRPHTLSTSEQIALIGAIVAIIATVASVLNYYIALPKLVSKKIEVQTHNQGKGDGDTGACQAKRNCLSK